MHNEDDEPSPLLQRESPSAALHLDRESEQRWLRHVRRIERQQQGRRDRHADNSPPARIARAVAGPPSSTERPQSRAGDAPPHEAGSLTPAVVPAPAGLLRLAPAPAMMAGWTVHPLLERTPAGPAAVPQWDVDD